MQSWGNAAAPGWRQGLWGQPLISEQSSALSGDDLSHWKVRPERRKYQRTLFPKVLDADPQGPARSPRPSPQTPGKAGAHLGGGHWYLRGGTVINPVLQVMAQRLWTCHLPKPCA